MKPQYKPALAPRNSPRVTKQFRARVNRLCKRWEMPESEVLRYCFDAAVLEGGKGLKRSVSSDPAPLAEMVTVRATQAVHRQFMDLWHRQDGALKYDIVRALLENMITMAEQRGMAYVMTVRERALAK